MTGYLHTLTSNGVIEFPPEVAAHGDRLATIYALVEVNDGVVPIDLTNGVQCDLSASMVYPSLSTLESEGLVSSELSTQRPGASVFVATGPSITNQGEE